MEKPNSCKSGSVIEKESLEQVVIEKESLKFEESIKESWKEIFEKFTKMQKIQPISEELSELIG